MEFFLYKKIILSYIICLMYESALSQVEHSKNMKFFVKLVELSSKIILQLQFDEQNFYQKTFSDAFIFTF